MTFYPLYTSAQCHLRMGAVIVLLCLMGGCSLKEFRNRLKRHGKGDQKEKLAVGMKESRRTPLRDKKLVVLFSESPYSYAIVDGTPVGMEYELLNLFAQDRGLELVVKIIGEKDHLLDSLRAGHGDIVAANLNVTRERSEAVDFTLPVLNAEHRLVQRAQGALASQKQNPSGHVFVERPEDLNFKTVVIQKGSSFRNSLLSYGKRHRLHLTIREVSGDISQEELMEMVAAGKIDYTLADANVAEAMAATRSGIDYRAPVAEAIPVCWALFKQSAGLQQALDEWILQRKHTLEFAMIVNKYTKLSAREQNKVRRQYQRAKAGIISPYDILLKNYARSANWDWRLLAALVFQESKFDPKARSRAGAVGLMQVLPATATWLGQKQIRLETPQANVKSGMLYLQWLKEKWQQHIYDKDEVIKFTLASYNAGFGHVWDARQLAKKYQLNPQRWEGNVERMLLQKSQPEYYQDPAVQYGYCRGKEPVDYVRNILAYYQHYQHVPL